MVSPAPLANRSSLRGWRARTWAWVLFLALFKGLIPHAALASVLMQGNPSLVWCAPGSAATSEQPGAAPRALAHDCVCIGSADGALANTDVGATTPLLPSAIVLPTSAVVLVAARPLPPPARGPPKL